MAKKNIFEKKKPAELLEKRRESLEENTESREGKQAPKTEIVQKVEAEKETVRQKTSKKDLKQQLLHPESSTSKGQNIRVKSETHAILKGTSLVKEQDMYSIMEEALRDYVLKQPKGVQEEIFNKVNGLIEFGMIKL